MICRDLGALFIHIPKAAGQSVERVLLGEMGLDWNSRAGTLLRSNTDPSKGPPRLAHLTAEEYVRLGWLDEKESSALFKFAFVRNPWARVVSEYQYRRLGPGIGFRQFVLERFPGPADDNYATSDDHYRHVLPQVRFLFNQKGECLVDFVGRFESIGSDFATVASKLGLKCTELPHSNASRQTPRQKDGFRRTLQDILRGVGARKTDYTAYFDSQTQRVVERLYEEDIARFGYSFGGP